MCVELSHLLCVYFVCKTVLNAFSLVSKSATSRKHNLNRPWNNFDLWPF